MDAGTVSRECEEDVKNPGVRCGGIGFAAEGSRAECREWAADWSVPLAEKAGFAPAHRPDCRGSEIEFPGSGHFSLVFSNPREYPTLPYRNRSIPRNVGKRFRKLRGPAEIRAAKRIRCWAGVFSPDQGGRAVRVPPATFPDQIQMEAETMGFPSPFKKLPLFLAVLAA